MLQRIQRQTNNCFSPLPPKTPKISARPFELRLSIVTNAPPPFFARSISASPSPARSARLRPRRVSNKASGTVAYGRAGLWTLVGLNNNNNKPCRDQSDTFTLKVFQGHFTELYYITVSLPEKRWQTIGKVLGLEWYDNTHPVSSSVYPFNCIECDSRSVKERCTNSTMTMNMYRRCDYHCFIKG